VAEKAPVRERIEIDKNMGISSRSNKKASALDQFSASCVGIRVAKQDLVRERGERPEECIRFPD
jgi:hypothetical protein